MNEACKLVGANLCPPARNNAPAPISKPSRAMTRAAKRTFRPSAVSEPIEKRSLQERVEQFRALELPGQSQSMHMGTLYLVNDLWAEVQRLRKALQLRDDT
jgi:hypothetical protein